MAFGDTGGVNNQPVALSDTDGVNNIFVAPPIFRWQYPGPLNNFALEYEQLFQKIRGVSNQAKLATRFINLKIFKDFGDFLRFSRFIEILKIF